MQDEKFYISRYLKSEDGPWVLYGVRKSLEDDFGGCIRYKSLSGLNSKGKQKKIYTESFVESDSLRVYASPVASHDTTTVTLSCCVFGYDVDGSTNLSVTEQIKAAENAWNDFYAFLEGCLVLWYDDFRQEKALLMLQDAVDPTTDNIKSIPYLLCSVKFVNIFGRSFGADDTTIETWLANGGKEEDNG